MINIPVVCPTQFLADVTVTVTIAKTFSTLSPGVALRIHIHNFIIRVTKPFNMENRNTSDTKVLQRIPKPGVALYCLELRYAASVYLISYRRVQGFVRHYTLNEL